MYPQDILYNSPPLRKYHPENKNYKFHPHWNFYPQDNQYMKIVQ